MGWGKGRRPGAERPACLRAPGVGLALGRLLAFGPVRWRLTPVVKPLSFEPLGILWLGVHPQNSVLGELVTLHVYSKDCFEPVCVLLGCNQIRLSCFEIGEGPALIYLSLLFLAERGDSGK